MAKAEPLSPIEEEFWRALMRIVLSLPRRLDSDLVDILRGVVLRGASVAELREPIMWLTAYTIGIIGLAVMRFKKTAE